MRLSSCSSISFLLLVVMLSAYSAKAYSVSLEELSQSTHFHGVAFDADNPEQLYLATHHGLYKVMTDVTARRISANRNDYMGFTPNPADPEILYASGHPERGGNLGFVVSEDGGKSWTQRAEGVNGPVDFHQMTVSKANPDVIYGAYHGQLQGSRDAGHTWRVLGQAPQGLIDLAASASRVSYVYAATRNGLQRSTDAGRNWQFIHSNRQPVSMVEVSAEGDIYAFMLGSGLLHSREGSLDWEVIGSGWGEGYLLHLDIDATDSDRLVAIDHQSRVLISDNGGLGWSEFGADQP